VTDGGESCFTCPAPCCTSYAVPLTGFDVWRLARGLKLPWREVAEPRLDRMTWEGFRIDDGDGRWGLFLRTSAGESCHFLMQLPDGQRRCGAHESRPLACRVYPWMPSGSTQLGLEIGGHALCPPPQRAHFEARTREARDPVYDELAERPLYKLAVLRWNEKKHERSFDEFVDWLFALYDALLPLRGPPDWRRAAQRLVNEFPLP
jgi:Fe-S-cluster containining protein